MKRIINFIIFLLGISVPAFSSSISHRAEEVAWKLHDNMEENGPFEIEISNLVFNDIRRSTVFSEAFIKKVGETLNRNFEEEFPTVKMQHLDRDIVRKRSLNNFDINIHRQMLPIHLLHLMPSQEHYNNLFHI